MLAVRVIPALLVRGKSLVKGQQFNSWRSVGVAMQSALIHASRGVDELMILDIAATEEGRGPDLQFVKQLTDKAFIPVTVGGGVRSLKQVEDLLRSGADKVLIGSAVFEVTGLLRECARRFGSQAIIAALDVDGEQIATRCGTVKHSMEQWNAISASRWLEEQGAGEILLTSIQKEGMMQGYDYPLIHAVSETVSVPVIAHGGCGEPQHMKLAVEMGADACASGAMFQFTDITPRQCAEYLSGNGVEVRL